MPKYQKDVKLDIWKDNEPTQDRAGAWHGEGNRKVGSVWANVRGMKYDNYYAIHASWPKETFVATVTRPSFEIEVGDHTKRSDKYYKIVSIDDLTAKPGRDMKLVLEIDPQFVPSDEGEIEG